ncbi:hypothetical protein, partial [Streptomyces sp. NPDC046197]|uniref:hypothetical protein n=1 Tax=Streptomyces sp. NPDC046197 TaxID=3154337 RepID=UPI0033C3572F
MAVDHLPGRLREFATYLDGLLACLDQGGGWCGVFWRRDPEGMRACREGREVPPWDVVEALLQDLAAEHGPAAAAPERERARLLHAAALAAYDARPGARDSLRDRLGAMLREQRYAAERQAQLSRRLASAATREEADALRVDLAWAQDDHERATARCAELRARIDRPDRLPADDHRPPHGLVTGGGAASAEGAVPRGEGGVGLWGRGGPGDEAGGVDPRGDRGGPYVGERAASVVRRRDEWSATDVPADGTADGRAAGAAAFRDRGERTAPGAAEGPGVHGPAAGGPAPSATGSAVGGPAPSATGSAVGGPAPSATGPAAGGPAPSATGSAVGGPAPSPTGPAAGGPSPSRIGLAPGAAGRSGVHGPAATGGPAPGAEGSGVHGPAAGGPAPSPVGPAPGAEGSGMYGPAAGGPAPSVAGPAAGGPAPSPVGPVVGAPASAAGVPEVSADGSARAPGQRRRRRGSARFAGAVEEETPAVAVPPGGAGPVLPASAAGVPEVSADGSARAPGQRRRRRGSARFA